VEPDLWELFEYGEAEDEVAAIIRLGHFGVVPQGVRVVAQFEDIITVRLSRRDIPKISGAAEVAGMSAGDTYLGPDLELDSVEGVNVPATSVVATDTRRPEGLGMTGRGIILGVVDWGFDFAHADLRKDDGSTRILALWDQRGGKRADSPKPFGYGIVHTRADINRALKEKDPYAALKYHPADADTGFGCHGTHVTSIAAGSGGVDRPTGIAPEADLVLVHNAPWDGLEAGKLGDSVTLLEGIAFISQTAAGNPWVVNLSMGRHGEQHDGSTLVELGLDAAVRSAPGRAVVLSTGNYFNKHIHASGQLRPTEERTFAWVINEGTPSDYNQLEVWYSWQDKFEVSVRSPDGAITAQAKLGEKVKLVSGGKEVGNVYHRAQEPNTMDHHITIFLYKTAPAGEWDITLSGTDVIHGDYHAWIEREVSCPACQSHFKAEDADPRSTTGTICNGRRTIAVGAYDAHDPEHRIGPFSSVGPTRDGRLKPDLCAPGVSVLAARSAPRQGADKAPIVTRMSGTSMAAPHVTGTVALMFQAAVKPLRIEETHNLLLGNAERVSIPESNPDRVGIGFLDVEGAVQAASGADHSNRTFKPVTAKPVPTKSVPAKPAMRGESGERYAQRGDVGVALAMADANEGEGVERPRRVSSSAMPVDSLALGAEMENIGSGKRAADLVELADQIVSGQDAGEPRRPLLQEWLNRQGLGGALILPGVGRPPTAAEIFNAIVYMPRGDLGQRVGAHFDVIATPGSMLRNALCAGDVLIRQVGGGYGHVAVVASPELRSAQSVLAAGGTPEQRSDGQFAWVVEGGCRRYQRDDVFSRRIVDEYGRVPNDQVILRPRWNGEASERIDPLGLVMGLTVASALDRPAAPAAPVVVTTGTSNSPSSDAEFDPTQIPKDVSDALQSKDWPRALQLAIDAGWRDPNDLTDLIFFARHPELAAGKLNTKDPKYKTLSAEWASLLQNDIWKAIQTASENTALAVSGAEVVDEDRFFWGSSGKRFKQLVEDCARDTDLNPGLLGTIMMAETRDPFSYLSSDKIDSYYIGIDDFYEARAAIAKRVPAYAKVGWDKTQTPRTHLNDAITPREVKSIDLDSGRDGALAIAVYIKFHEVRLREIAKDNRGDFDALSAETRFALTRAAMAAGTGGATKLLTDALAGKDIMVRKAIPVKIYQTQRNATVRAAQALHLSDWIFGIKL
jgi:subtilisin family serine protease